MGDKKYGTKKKYSSIVEGPKLPSGGELTGYRDGSLWEIDEYWRGTTGTYPIKVNSIPAVITFLKELYDNSPPSYKRMRHDGR